MDIVWAPQITSSSAASSAWDRSALAGPWTIKWLWPWPTWIFLQSGTFLAAAVETVRPELSYFTKCIPVCAHMLKFLNVCLHKRSMNSAVQGWEVTFLFYFLQEYGQCDLSSVGNLKTALCMDGELFNSVVLHTILHHHSPFSVLKGWNRKRTWSHVCFCQLHQSQLGST